MTTTPASRERLLVCTLAVGFKVSFDQAHLKVQTVYVTVYDMTRMNLIVSRRLSTSLYTK